ncbi:peptidylprolyl isomerase [Thauera sp.]|uniref:peptidylprolyl isomerase n=1 Tax=Thauera sp. TaxID=1905334 RepID=UPI0039E6A1BA
MKKHLIAFAALASTALTSLGALAANPMVELKTSQGEIVVEVFADKAPKSAENFVQYVKDGFYNGTVFHRVIDGFMVQGGGFDADMKQKSTRAPVENEAKNGLKNERGTLAMARTADPHSASSQFFINLVPNTFLDYPSRDGWGYAVFGKVVKGMDVVDKIAKVQTGNRGFHQNVPVEAVIIENASVLEKAPAKKAGK